MTKAGAQARDSLLAVRERYFTPTVVAPFADDLARRLTRLSMGPLLEIEADTGVLTQAIASAMSAGLTIIATDPAADRVEFASAKPGMARVTWQRAEPGALPFPDTTFGIVACQFAVATLPDRVKAFREVRRVIKPNGRFAFSVPGHIRHNPVAECVHAAVADLFPADPLDFIGQGLHGYADNEAIDDDLTAAGFTDAIYTTVDLPFAAASARDVALGYCLGTPLRPEILRHAPQCLDQAVDAVAVALRKRFGDNAIQASMRAHVIFASG